MTEMHGPCLVADIGGTRMRVALVQDDVLIGGIAELSCADFAGPAQALLECLAATGAKPFAACLAVAGPVTGDRFRFTNSTWDFSADALRMRLGLKRLLVRNDFEALALALPNLGVVDLHALGAGAPVPSKGQTMAVLGPGTGLGVAALASHADRWIAMPGEGGHIGFSPQDELESEIARVFRRTRTRVSNEDILSGNGLVNLYNAIGAVLGQPAVVYPSPAELTRCALRAEDALAVQTVEVFCAVLGAVAGDVALLTGARGGVFIGGGIAPRILPILQRSRFRTRFEDKGLQRDYVKGITTSVIVTPYAALLGAVAALRAEPHDEPY